MGPRAPRTRVRRACRRARIDIPDGFEYGIAELGRATTTALGDIELDVANSYGQFAEIHRSHTGMVRGAR
ncbi:MAG: hypothetical protein QF926_16085 [Alphaproteobacteria bacterium]|jgi:hypothetical protein|nr:hypothetical protein [Alphaproteobacteria bacterium]